ncbi:MAG: histone deacetylase [Calditrichaeota bacterium]|nr:histone deacetylase [Calditrichota bacterium]
MSILGIATHKFCQEHDAGPDHPERWGRVAVILDALQRESLWESVREYEARAATVEEVSYIHNPKYIEAMRRLCEKGGEFLPSMDAAVGPESYPAALHAAGAGLTLADEIMNGQIQMGFAAIRPPGHHSIYARPWGFCIFNNISILAKYLIEKYSLKRIAVVDFDVHHGNGTEQAFWADPKVLYCSIHQEDYFPADTGNWHDTGEGEGEGFTINIPVAARCDDETWLSAFDRYAIPRLEEFEPQIVLVSVGFDGHWRDIISGIKLTGKAFSGIGSRILKIAEGSADGKIISVLEGGYDDVGTAEGAVAYFSALMSRTE